MKSILIFLISTTLTVIIFSNRIYAAKGFWMEKCHTDSNCLIQDTLFRQAHSTRFQIGIEGGPGLTMLRDTWFFFSDHTSVAIGLGGAIGVSFQYNFNDRLAVRTNLSYERKGWQNKSGSFHERYDYLILPVLLRINLGKKSRTFLNVGPYIGYLFSHSSKMDNRIYYYKEWEFTKFDFGMTLGFGVNIPVTRQFGATMEIRDNFGMVNIENGDEEDKTYTNSTVIQFGFVYNFGKR